MNREEKIKELEDKKEEYDKLYTQGENQVSDEEYDKLIKELKSLKPESELLKKVGSPVVGSKKVKLPHTMGSLTDLKFHDGSIQRWIRNHSSGTRYIITQKLDGISCQLIYIDGNLTSGFTRGDGFEGKNITTSVRKMIGVQKTLKDNIPNYISIRGECVINEETFLQKYAPMGFKTSRNMIAGLLNKDDVSLSILQDVMFLPYEIKVPDFGKEYQLHLLEEWRFLPIKRVIVDNITPESLRDILNQMKSESPFLMDGIVIDIDDLNTRKNLGFEGSTLNPSYAKSFKIRSSDNEYFANVHHIEWNVSKNGLVKPRVMFDPPVEIQQVQVTWASGKNAKIIQELSIAPGSIVVVTRAGDTVPDILSTSVPGNVQLPTQCPSCGSSLSWDDNHINLVCTNSECSQKRLKQVSSFFTTIKVFGVSEDRIAKLVENGFDSVDKILRITENDIKSIEGFGEKSANNILESMRKACSQVTLSKLMYASGFFGKSLGSTKLENIVKVYGIDQVLDMYNKTNFEVYDLINKIPGFSKITSADFAIGIKLFVPWYNTNKYMFIIKTSKEEPMNIKSNKLSGQVVVFTKFRDKSLEEYVTSNGGTVGTDVNKNTTILVCKDINKSSNKIDKAKNLNIKILDVESFRKLMSLS